MSKSKDTKTKATTARRKAATKPAIATEGMPPADFLTHLNKTAENRLQAFELVKTNVFTTRALPRANQPTHRLPIPFDYRRRVKVGPEDDYFPLEYTKADGTEYMLAQAPTKDNYKIFWKAILQDFVKIVVCLTGDDEMGDDVSKCYPYFPTEIEQPMVIEFPKWKITVVLKSKDNGSSQYTRWNLEWTEDKNNGEPSESDLPSNVNRARPLIIFQPARWSGNRPETGNPLEQAEEVANFFHDVNKAEIEVMRKSMEVTVSPVIIQSMDGINRGPTAWVIMLLCKEVEKRESFDLIDLIKRIQKIRPGSLSSYFSFAFCIAVGLNVAIHAKWCDKDCKAALTDLMAKFPERKLNEYGQIAN